MKKRRFVLALALAYVMGFCVTSCLQVATAQVAKVWFIPVSQLKWDPVTQDILNNPETIAACEVGLFALGKDPNAIPPAAAIKTEQSTVPSVFGGGGFSMANIANALPGGDYDLRVRVKDLAGNWGSWSAPFGVSFDPAPPKSPTGLRFN